MISMSKGRWTCLIVLVVMIIILLNAEGCARLILQNDHIVYGRKLSDQYTGFYLSEELKQENKNAITLP